MLFSLDQLVHFNFCRLRFGDKPAGGHLWHRKVSPICPFEAHLRSLEVQKQPGGAEQ
jgi:hypothetical protein